MRRERNFHDSETHHAKESYSALHESASGTAPPPARLVTNPPSVLIDGLGNVEVDSSSATATLQRSALDRAGVAAVASKLSTKAHVPGDELIQAQVGRSDSTMEGRLQDSLQTQTAPQSQQQQEPMFADAALKVLPASSFVIGSDGIETTNLLSHGAEEQAAATAAPAAAVATVAPAAPAAVAAAVAPTAATVAPAAATAATEAPSTATAAPVLAATAAPAAQAAVAPVVPVAAAAAPATPVAAAASAPAVAASPADASGGGSSFFMVLFLLIGAILLAAIFAVRAKMSRPPAGGRLLDAQASADGTDSQFWKSAKARQSYRKSYIANPEDSQDSQSGSKDPTGPVSFSQIGSGQRRNSRGPARDTYKRESRSDNSGTDGAGRAVPSTSSYRDRREKEQKRASIVQSKDKAGATNDKVAKPDADSGADSEEAPMGKEMSYRSRRNKFVTDSQAVAASQKPAEPGSPPQL